LALEAGLSVANASQHLQVLRQAGLVEVHREGKFSYYRLAGKEAFRTWQSIRDFGAVKVQPVPYFVSRRGHGHNIVYLCVEFARFCRKRCLIKIFHVLRTSCDHVYPLRRALSPGIADHRR
jgi:DNA-binding transcriptional ArsR family regulator